MLKIKDQMQRKQMLVLVAIFCSALFAPFSVYSESESSQMAEQIIQSTKQFEEEAKNLKSSEIYKIIKSDIELRSIKSEEIGIDFSAIYDKNFQRSVGYVTALEKRRKANEADGAFYYGLYKLRECSGLSTALSKRQETSIVKDCFNESLESFKVAANANIAAAAYNVGILYMQGRGVNASKYVAANWFIRAAMQHNTDGSRDEALSSLEMALNLVPDHPSALKLRIELLK